MTGQNGSVWGGVKVAPCCSESSREDGGRDRIFESEAGWRGKSRETFRMAIFFAKTGVRSQVLGRMAVRMLKGSGGIVDTQVSVGGRAMMGLLEGCQRKGISNKSTILSHPGKNEPEAGKKKQQVLTGPSSKGWQDWGSRVEGVLVCLVVPVIIAERSTQDRVASCT